MRTSPFLLALTALILPCLALAEAPMGDLPATEVPAPSVPHSQSQQTQLDFIQGAPGESVTFALNSVYSLAPNDVISLKGCGTYQIQMLDTDTKTIVAIVQTVILAAGAPVPAHTAVDGVLEASAVVNPVPKAVKPVAPPPPLPPKLQPPLTYVAPAVVAPKPVPLAPQPVMPTPILVENPTSVARLPSSDNNVEDANHMAVTFTDGSVSGPGYYRGYFVPAGTLLTPETVAAINTQIELAAQNGVRPTAASLGLQ